MRSVTPGVTALAITAGLALAQSPKNAALSPAFGAASLKLDNAPLGRGFAIGIRGGPGTDDPGVPVEMLVIDYMDKVPTPN